MPLEARPERPRPELLDEARANLASRLGIDSESSIWVVGERMERKRSTLFPLALASPMGDRLATAYYKVPYFPPEKQGSRNLERARLAVVRARTFGDRFAALGADTHIEINVTLAADLDTLETVTLGLEGPPMGSPLRLMVTAGRRSQALTACRRVGEAVRIMEKMDLEDGDSSQEEDESSQRKLDSATSFLSVTEIESLEGVLDDLYRAAVAEDGTTLAHGDLSTGNIILMEGRTGIIDFLWLDRIRGFDLSRFVHRLRHSTTALRPWTEGLVGAALEGYGDASVTERPGWRFWELMHLLTTLRLLERRGRIEGRAARQALAGLRTAIHE